MCNPNKKNMILLICFALLLREVASVTVAWQRVNVQNTISLRCDHSLGVSSELSSFFTAFGNNKA